MQLCITYVLLRTTYYVYIYIYIYIYLYIYIYIYITCGEYDIMVFGKGILKTDD